MSLLIKALEKAEQGKKAGDLSTAADELSLQDDYAPDSRRDQSEPQYENAQRKAAAMLSARTASSSVSKTTLLFSGVAILLVLGLGIGLYLYLQTLSKPELVMAHAEAPVQTSVQPSEPSAAPVTSSSDMGTVDTQAQEQDNTSSHSIASPVSAQEDSAKPAERSKAQPQVFGEPVSNSPDTTVKVTRTRPAPGVHPSLASAYQALVAGDDAAAQRNYRIALQNEPGNVDAMLGLATVAAHQGRTLDAQAWYNKVLEVEPRNTTAQAALIELGGQADPVSSETRIKNLIARQPEAAYLYAALGDLYAGQDQWPAAQQAYFQAHHYQPENAQYLYNLAVSLDQMGKQALALQYYQQTLSVLERGNAGDIDRNQLSARIAQLSQQ